MALSSEIDVADLKKAEHVEVSPKIVEIDTFRVVGISDEDAEFYKEYPEEKRKRIFRKVRNYYAGFAVHSL